MNMKDEDIINYFVTTRNIQPITKTSYVNVFKKYTSFNQMTLQELLIEAENEEEQGIRWKNRTLKKRLIAFRNWLQQNFLNNTAKKNFSRILTFYRHFEIEVHTLPPFNEKNSNFETPITFDKLPDTEIIKKALNLKISPVLKATILFMSSSGCSRAETLNLKISDFIEATGGYHDKNNIYDVIDVLKERNDVIPTFKLWRKKTNKFYYTFCTPEATTAILDYLISIQKPFTNNDKLFDIHPAWLSYRLADINDNLGLGKIGKHRRFRCHMLRKFHASQLYNDGMSLDEVDALQGRGKNSTHTAYFLEDPLKLKEKYIEHMNCVSINMDVNNIDIKSPEFVELENKVSEQDKIITEYENIFENIDARIEEKINSALKNSDGLDDLFR